MRLCGSTSFSLLLSTLVGSLLFFSHPVVVLGSSTSDAAATAAAEDDCSDGKGTCTNGDNNNKKPDENENSSELETRLAAHDLGTPQEVSDSSVHDAVFKLYDMARKFKQDNQHIINERSLNECVNKNKHCAVWAATGSCESNAHYMGFHCPLMCGVCEDLVEEFEEHLREGSANDWGAERYLPKNECEEDTDLFDCQIRAQRHPNIHTYDCDTTFDWYGFLGYMEAENIKSAYQEITFIAHPETKDTCFDIDSITQICTSYRPHYHEMSVHYAARFLPSVKRVLFVGGGDSMLLHEVLKYDSLELVMGLELDQKVTRAAFKYMGVQPRFDAHDKVQWWFGDATKSLLMLPKEYFGSFDMVLVDLSETVMSFEVTEGIDIMQALSLLIKPEGIMLKNELYLEQLAHDFEHTLQYSFGDNPVICSQAMVLGSNGVDFLHRELTDHGIEDFKLIQQLDDIEWRKEMYDDYIYNSTRAKFCKEDFKEKEPEIQEKSPGILMIVEAEKTTVPLTPSTAVESLVVDVLKNQGLTVKSTIVSESNVVVVIMAEGYVMARTWPEDNYVAFDVHMWSQFEAQEKVKDGLIKAVGSKIGDMASHSYRVVAGGMFGVETWKEDELKRGPRYTEECSKRKPVVDETVSWGTFPTSLLEKIVKETVDVMGDRNAKKRVIVVCGEKSPEDGCDSEKWMKDLGSVDEVLTLVQCSSMETQDSQQKCGTGFAAQISKFTSGGKGIDAIVLDPSAPQVMGQIMHRIITTDKGKSLLSLDLVVAAPILNEESDAWRRNFLDRVTTDVFIWEQAHHAHVLLQTTTEPSSTMDMGVFANDTMFFDNIETLVDKIQEETGLKSQFNTIRHGLDLFQEDWYNSLPTRNWKHDDYDQTSGLQQWMDQKPLGHQTVVQYETIGTRVIVLNPERIEKAMKSTLDDADARDDWSTTRIEKYNTLGDGTLLVAISDEFGSMMVLWDGKSHVDIHLFTYKENSDFANFIVTTFLEKSKVLEKKLHDEMPRGTGGVLNFEKMHDLKTPRQLPFFAGGEIPLTPGEQNGFQGKDYNVEGFEGLPM